MRLNRTIRRGALYLPYQFNQGNNVLGHYRSSTGLLTTSGNVGAASVVFSGIFGGVNLAAVLRVQIGVQVTTALTTAVNFGFNLFSFTGATAAASGSSSVVSKSGGANMRPNMPLAQWFNGIGEMRGLGGSLTGLTAASNKTNSGNPIGSCNWSPLQAVNATGTAVALPVGAGSGMMDLFPFSPGVSHPLVLGTNSGIEIQQITASGAAALSYIVVVEWAEVLTL